MNHMTNNVTVHDYHTATSAATLSGGTHKDYPLTLPLLDNADVIYTMQLSINLVRISYVLFIAAALIKLYNDQNRTTQRTIKQEPNPAKPCQPLPGPRWYSLLLFILRRRTFNFFDALDDLRHVYGDVYRVYIGSRPITVLCGAETVRRALVGTEEGESQDEGKRRAIAFSGRPRLRSFALASQGASMSFNSCSYPQWNEHRRLAQRAMKAMNRHGEYWLTCADEARKLTEEFLQCEAVETVSDASVERETSAGLAKSFDPRDRLRWSVARVMYRLCYGGCSDSSDSSDLNVSDVDLEAMSRCTFELIDCNSRGSAVDFLPKWARRFFTCQKKALEALCSRMLAITYRKHEDHVKSYSVDRIRDIQDALIRYGLHDHSNSLEEHRVIMTVQEYIGAGLDIIYASLLWTLLYITKFPGVQQSIQDELDSVVGRVRDPTADDIRSLPYTEAVVLEVLRHSSVIPLALPHATTEDTQINGIWIPRDMFVMINLHSVNNDEKVYESPREFNPERFLVRNVDGKPMAVVGRELCYQFGMGKRQCIGADFSRTMLVLYVSTLLHGCTLKPAKGRSLDSYSLKAEFGVILKPSEFQIVVHRRR